jgi:hypothetical protein
VIVDAHDKATKLGRVTRWPRTAHTSSTTTLAGPSRTSRPERPASEHGGRVSLLPSGRSLDPSEQASRCVGGIDAGRIYGIPPERSLPTNICWRIREIPSKKWLAEY